MARPNTRGSSKRLAPHEHVPLQAESAARGGPSSECTPPADEAANMHTPKSSRDVSRLSEGLEPLNIQDDDTAARGSTDTIEEEEAPGFQANALGADVNHVKEAIATISKLQGLGLQQFDIPLPKCVVLGEQSTGKSSVIEAISGIKTPRSTDTCTRCPLFIQLEDSKSQGARWHARVLLRLTYKYCGNTNNGHKDDRFPGWKLSERPEEVEFEATDSTERLEGLIARAQLAILNGGDMDTNIFRQGPLERLNKFKKSEFSPNCVCIYISKPGLPSLSFYDLPGIIGQAEDARNTYLVKFVRDLVTEYISDKESLILVTCALSNDIHNSTAAGIARDLHATQRCVGVLTKPDCLPPGTRKEKLEAVLEGRTFTLGHGYFVVKNLDQHAIDQGVTNRAARAQEIEFFQKNAPWAEPGFQRFQERFGTENLQRYLAKKLAAQTLSALPAIRSSIQSRLEEVDSQLLKLPETPRYNAIHIVHEILHNFTRQVEREMEGEHGHNTWRNLFEEIQETFAADLMSMKPKLSTLGNLDIGIGRPTSKAKTDDVIIVLDSSEEDEEEVWSPPMESPSKKRKVNMETPIKTGGRMPVTPSSSKPLRKGPSKTSGNGKSTKPTEKFPELGITFNLDEVATKMKELSKSKLPDELEPHVLYVLIRDSIKNWHLPLGQYFDLLEMALRRCLRQIFDKYFGDYSDALLYRTTWDIIENLLKCHFGEQRSTMAPEALLDEQRGPYMFYAKIWEAEKANVQELYKQSRYKARLRRYFADLDEVSGKTTSAAEREAKAQKDSAIRSIINKEPYQSQLDTIAKVTSYYNIASRRFHDSVAMRIESKFFWLLRTALMKELEDGLQTGGPGAYENCVRLLADNPAREARRRELQETQERLLQGQQMLDALVDKYGDHAPTSSSAVDEMMDVAYGGH